MANKKVVRKILQVNTSSHGCRVGLAAFGSTKIVTDIKFIRDGLISINTKEGCRDNSCYVVTATSPEDNKQVETFVIPYPKVEWIQYEETPIEKNESCDEPSVPMHEIS